MYICKGEGTALVTCLSVTTRERGSAGPPCRDGQGMVSTIPWAGGEPAGDRPAAGSRRHVPMPCSLAGGSPDQSLQTTLV